MDMNAHTHSNETKENPKIAREIYNREKLDAIFFFWQLCAKQQQQHEQEQEKQ